MKDRLSIAPSYFSVVSSHVFVGLELGEDPFEVQGGNIERERVLLA